LLGQVAEVVGSPVISSMAMTLYDADGKYTTTTPATNDTKGSIATFNKRGFVSGWRRRVRVEALREPGLDQTKMIYSLRQGFGRYSPTGVAAGLECADVIYNITV
jgi:hypothetical protein